MKQHITVEQYNELSGKGKENLWKWLVSRGYGRHISEHGQNYYVFYCSGTCDYPECNFNTPPLSIGQMIEFLDESKHVADITREDPYAYFKDKIKVLKGWFVRVDIKGNRTVYRNDELCDALWEAVKEVLNG